MRAVGLWTVARLVAVCGTGWYVRGACEDGGARRQHELRCATVARARLVCRMMMDDDEMRCDARVCATTTQSVDESAMMIAGCAGRAGYGARARVRAMVG